MLVKEYYNLLESVKSVAVSCKIHKGIKFKPRHPLLKKNDTMTQAELRFLETMPTYMGQLVSEIEKLNLRVKELTDKVEELKNNEK